MGFGYLTVRQSYIEYNNNNIRAPPKLSIKYVHIMQGFSYCKGSDIYIHSNFYKFIEQVEIFLRKCISKDPAEVFTYMDYRKNMAITPLMT